MKCLLMQSQRWCSALLLLFLCFRKIQTERRTVQITEIGSSRWPAGHQTLPGQHAESRISHNFPDISPKSEYLPTDIGVNIKITYTDYKVNKTS